MVGCQDPSTQKGGPQGRVDQGSHRSFRDPHNQAGQQSSMPEPTVGFWWTRKVGRMVQGRSLWWPRRDQTLRKSKLEHQLWVWVCGYGARPDRETSLKDRSWKSKDNLVRGLGGGSEHMLLFSGSVMSDSATPWTTARQPSLSFTISWSLLKLMSIESVMTSNHLFLCHPLLFLPLIFPSIRVFSSKSALYIRWPKYWSFSFSMGPSNEYSGLISFRIN